MLKGALLGYGHVAAEGHAPGWRARPDVEIVAAADARPGRRTAFFATFPQGALVHDGRGPAHEGESRLRRHLHAPGLPRPARPAGARAIPSRALREAARRVAGRAAGAPRALGREGARGRHGAQLAFRARRREGRRGHRLGRARGSSPRSLADPAQPAGGGRGRRRQLAGRPGAVGRRRPRRPRLARLLRRVGLDGRGAAHRRGAPGDAQVPRVADRGHRRSLPRLPGGLGRDPPDLGGPRSGPTARRSPEPGACCGSTAASSRSSSPTGRP